MILGAHNWLTNGKPKHWYNYLMIPFAKCQKSNTYNLYKKGVRCFDLRVRFNSFVPIAAHGLMELDVDVLRELNELYTLMSSDNSTVYIRIILESIKKEESPKEDTRFINFFMNINHNFPNFKYIGGNRKGNWHKVINFLPDAPEGLEVIQPVSSMAYSDKRIVPARWYEKILPKRYAKRCNKQNLETFKDVEDVVLFDFI